MPASTHVIVPVRRLTAQGQQHFFGYYDVPAADPAGRHLCHHVQFRDRFPRPDDVALLGWLPLPSRASEPDGAPAFVPFAETRAWNFQQGAMLQWLPAQPDTCIYNVFENGQWGACLHNVRTGARCRLPLPVASLAHDGTKALCINMARVFDFRAGYGYEELPDPFARSAAPTEDGIFLMNLATGQTRLIISLAAAVAFLEQSRTRLAGRKVVVNHLSFNPAAARFLFLLRTFPKGPGGQWSTFLLTADANGGGLRHHPVHGMASHYHWRDDDTMLFYATAAAGGQPELMLISDRTGARHVLDPAFFRQDGHCSYSPDRRWILYDSYPDPTTPDCLRDLQVYSLERRAGITLGRFRAEPITPATADLRCDLHPRWMPAGTAITFDSIHAGERAVYWADLRGIV